MARRSKKLDIVFVLDATNSTGCVFTELLTIMNDVQFQIHIFNTDIDDHYGVVIYRDPIDNPEDKNDFMKVTSNREAVCEFLSDVEPSGGGDDPEDWAGAFELALHNIRWREGSRKCLFWIADACAHGSEYSYERRDRHEEEGPKLTRLIEEAAARRIYFMGVNVKRAADRGCEKTLAKLREIYKAAGVENMVRLRDLVFTWTDGSWESDDFPFEDFWSMLSPDPLYLLGYKEPYPGRSNIIC